jgi:hypothetical protein
MKVLNSQPDSLDWYVYRNDTTNLTVVVRDSQNEALDLTNWEFSGSVRETPRTSSVITELNITRNEDVLSIFLDTENLNKINYFDIEAKNNDLQKTTTVLKGIIYVEEDVTR